jgi:hypothetical protein
VRLRGLLRQHEQSLLKLGDGSAKAGAAAAAAESRPKPVATSAAAAPKTVAPFQIKSPQNRANVERFDNYDAKTFKVDDCPQIKDCELFLNLNKHSFRPL